MRDPHEGIDDHGRIVTGIDRDRVPPRFEPVLVETCPSILDRCPTASVYLYGSVATGRARSPGSDIDLIAVGLGDADAARIAHRLSSTYATLCRSVDVGAASADDFAVRDDAGDENYGNRVFLHHYCLHLAGPDHREKRCGFPADARAARGFKGDIAAAADRWRGELPVDDPIALQALRRRIALKTLLAVAGLVSVHDGTWTTDRGFAAARWADVQPCLEGSLRRLQVWAEAMPDDDSEAPDPKAGDVEAALDGVVVQVVERFRDTIRLWGQHARPEPATAHPPAARARYADGGAERATRQRRARHEPP